MLKSSTGKDDLISFVVPVLNERENLPLFVDTVKKVMAEESVSFEFVFIDDGSTDGSSTVISEIAQQQKNIKLVRLVRNFGSHVAIAAGLKKAKGDAVVIMAADLQDPPSVISDFLVKWRDGAEVVWGVRRKRDDSWSSKLTSGLFYTLIRRIALPNYPKGGTGSFCLLSADVVKDLDQFGETNRITFGLISWIGRREERVDYDRAARVFGQSGWTLARQVKAALDTIVAFSYAPIRFASGLGIALSAFALFWSTIVFIRWLTFGIEVPGWTSVFLAVMVLGGIQLLVLGIIGEYVWRTLDQVRQRPQFLVREYLDFSENAPVEKKL